MKIAKNIDITERVRMVKEMLRLNMDGATAQRLRPLGYRLAFGVTYPRLKELVTEIEPDSELADRLWGLKLRETMIISTLIFPTNDIDIESLYKMCSEVMNEEIAEYLVRNLLVRYSNASVLTQDLYEKSESENTGFYRMMSFSLASRVLIQSYGEHNSLCDFFFDKAVNLVTNKIPLKSYELSSVALFVRQYLSYIKKYGDSYYNTIGNNFVTLCRNSDIDSYKWIAEEIDTYINYSLL